MFGCVVAGRLLQTNLTQVDETHAFFELPHASTINHLTVFMTGDVPFPEGYGASVHFYWPGKGFQLLGMISNDKPSAIFRLRGTFHSSSTAAHTAFSSTNTSGMTVPSNADVTANLGLAIEPLQSIESQIALTPHAVARSAANVSVDPTLLAERTVKHLFNYIAGFAGGIGGGGISPELAVPMSVIQKWYETFLGKLRAGGVGFLERGE